MELFPGCHGIGITCLSASDVGRASGCPLVRSIRRRTSFIFTVRVSGRRHFHELETHVLLGASVDLFCFSNRTVTGLFSKSPLFFGKLNFRGLLSDHGAGHHPFIKERHEGLCGSLRFGSGYSEPLGIHRVEYLFFCSNDERRRAVVGPLVKTASRQQSFFERPAGEF